MASSPSPFSNPNKFQVLPTAQTTLLFTQSGNNNLTINNIASPMQYIRQTSTPNGTFNQQQPISSGVITTPSSILRLNQPISTSNTPTSQTVWLNNATQLSPKPTIKAESSTPIGIPQQSTILPTKLVAQPVVRQTVTAPQQQQTTKFTNAQINDFVAKCRTFLTTLLKLAEKQAPEKLPMVRSCIQDLLDGTIDPESFTQRLHTLYKSQPHTSLVPFFKLALPHMRQIVKSTFGRPITIELLEKLNLPSSKSGNAITTTTMTTASPSTSRVVVNPSLLAQQSPSLGQQPLLYTTVQPQQKINLLQQTSQPSLIGSTASLLSQQQQQQQQARAQISITGLRPFLGTISPSTNTNLLSDIQPITQTILQQSDSLPQRTSFLSSTPQQTQLITVNHQPILNNLSSLQQPQIQIQPRTILKNDEDSSDDIHGNSGLLTASSGPVDDRHTRHITHDDRFLSAVALRRRLDHLGKRTPRSEGGNTLIVHDDSVCALISHATEERLKSLIQQIKSLAQQRMKFSPQSQSPAMESNEMEQDLVTDSGVKRKLDDSSEHISTDRSSMIVTNHKRLKSSKRQYQANLLDLVGIMEKDKHLKRSTLRYKALDRSS